MCEAASISLNRNTVPGDASELSPGGVRIGTPAMTTRGCTTEDFKRLQISWPGGCWLQLLLTFLKGVTLYLVMGDGESLHERSDWGDQVDGVIHNLYQLFGVGALAHRGLPPFIGGLCGDHSPHRTTMTQTKCCPILHFGLWWLQDDQSTSEL